MNNFTKFVVGAAITAVVAYVIVKIITPAKTTTEIVVDAVVKEYGTKSYSTMFGRIVSKLNGLGVKVDKAAIKRRLKEHGVTSESHPPSNDN